jgi:hypothetical protein
VSLGLLRLCWLTCCCCNCYGFYCTCLSTRGWKQYVDTPFLVEWPREVYNALLWPVQIPKMQHINIQYDGNTRTAVLDTTSSAISNTLRVNFKICNSREIRLWDNGIVEDSTRWQ